MKEAAVKASRVAWYLRQEEKWRRPNLTSQAGVKHLGSAW